MPASSISPRRESRHGRLGSRCSTPSSETVSEPPDLSKATSYGFFDKRKPNETSVLDDHGQVVPPGTTGTLYVRGPHVMMGYWNLPDETAHMLKPGLYPGERMLCTHDLFRTDEDGFLYFVGRSDDIIKSRGEKVSPVEVENVLAGVPGIKEAAVVGVPDELLGQAVRAYVVLDPGHAMTEREFRRACMTRLENYMVPRDVVFLDELPKTGSGKVRKKSLVEAEAS